LRDIERLGNLRRLCSYACIDIIPRPLVFSIVRARRNKPLPRVGQSYLCFDTLRSFHGDRIAPLPAPGGPKMMMTERALPFAPPCGFELPPPMLVSPSF
jgi:hypothetical protein